MLPFGQGSDEGIMRSDVKKSFQAHVVAERMAKF